MQFQVPQFIETEDKIIGPLTLKQFLFIAAATLSSFGLYFVLTFLLWVIVAAVLEGAALILALLKINGRPMTMFAYSAFSYIWSPRVYLFREAAPATAAQVKQILTVPTIRKAPAGVGQNLRSLLDKLTTSKEAIPEREQPLPTVLKATSRESVKERYELIKKITGDKEVARHIDYR